MINATGNVEHDVGMLLEIFIKTTVVNQIIREPLGV